MRYLQKLTSWPRHMYDMTRWKLGFCRRLRRYPPVFVFQMGKVASRSIQEPLFWKYPGAVIHGHQLSATYPQGEARELYHYIYSDNPPDKLFVISPVRDPISRNISAFFQNYETHAGVSPETCRRTNEEIMKLFLEKFPHDQPLVFFDNNIKSHFGIDVYQKPFPNCGYDTYHLKCVRLLVLRVELPDEVKNRCIRDFVGVNDFSVSGSNISANKPYGPLYKRFVSQCNLPRDYVDWMCTSKYFQHFYSPDNIEATRRRWLKSCQ